MDRRYPIQPFDPELFREFFGADTEQLTATLLTGGACNSNYWFFDISSGCLRIQTFNLPATK